MSLRGLSLIRGPYPESRNFSHLFGEGGEPAGGGQMPDVGLFPWRLLFTETGLLPTVILLLLFPFGQL